MPVHLSGHLERKAIRFHQGDVRDRALMTRLVGEVDGVIHLAAQLGLGQSMYKPYPFADVNIGGTALLMEILTSTKHHVRKIVVASSMSLYGEGAYVFRRIAASSIPRSAARRSSPSGKWELFCPRCGKETTPAPTPEEKPLSTTTIYAITKKVQEEMSDPLWARLPRAGRRVRYFNVYGPRNR